MGVGGSGKQSLCRLAAFISGFSVVQIVISSTYGVSDLKDDLKAIYVTAGMKEEGVVLLLTDSQITDERFLIYINDLLASGNIPDLYTPEEVSSLVLMIHSHALYLTVSYPMNQSHHKTPESLVAFKISCHYQINKITMKNLLCRTILHHNLSYHQTSYCAPYLHYMSSLNITAASTKESILKLLHCVTLSNALGGCHRECCGRESEGNRPDTR